MMKLALFLSILLIGIQSVRSQLCDTGANALTSRGDGRNIPRKCIWVGATYRCYYIYIPDCATGYVPLVVDMHGSFYCPSTFFTHSGWMEKAETQPNCFAVVWPTGNQQLPGSCWQLPGGARNPSRSDFRGGSCCCGGSGDSKGDMQFLRAIGKDVSLEVPKMTNNRAGIDGTRIYMTGHSNGCIAAFAMALQHSDYVAGVMCFAGGMVSPPRNYSPRPMWIVHGLPDAIIPYTGAGQYMPVQDGFKEIKRLNRCRQSDSVSKKSVSSMNSLFVGPGEMTTQTAQGCDAPVQLVTLSTAGHFPYKDVIEITPPWAATTKVDTAQMAMDFVFPYRLKQAAAELRALPAINFSFGPPPAAATRSPTNRPTTEPTRQPTSRPTAETLTVLPTEEPTTQPTEGPTPAPTDPDIINPNPGPGLNGVDTCFRYSGQVGDLVSLRKMAALDQGLLYRVDPNGWQVIHEAVRAGQVDIVEELIMFYGVDMNVKTGAGNTPLNLARQFLSENHDVTQLLIELLAVDDGPDLGLFI